MTTQNQSVNSANSRVVILCVGLVAGMVGLSYAAVPLYRIFCQITGFGGTTQRADAPSGTVIDRIMKIRFDANSSSSLDWTFEPAQKLTETNVGEQTMAFYRAVNNSNEQVTGTATFNVSPAQAGAYFSKIECFCFTEQTLKPGESVDMPVVFFIDPEIETDVDLKALKTITLSYTFYPAKPSQRTSVIDSPVSAGSTIN